uniref:NADH-ubiquinone oxidoreductase chain 5 n=1 Tax=Mesargus serrata TaxID=2901391 RepID=A0A8K2AU15_9HEMI|nr:NADH dehydrogenase subunit 5 [Mesargus serrata]
MFINYYFFWGLFLGIFSVVLFCFGLNFLFYDQFILVEFSFLNLTSCNLTFTMIFDWVSLNFCSVVCLISSMVVFYSYQYMGKYSYCSIRFLFLVLLFILSMLMMVFSPNMISILIGWDGLGLVSYCLVVYYSSVKSYLSGMITCLTNRLGDIGLIISLSWVSSFGSWHFMFYNEFFHNSLYLLLIFSCFTKSAQIPFSCWLPAAMAAPTPVSALVHSSTLVTAGVYYVYRFFYDYIYLNVFFLLISFLTMFMSSLCAMFEYDLKKIIALSTLSQLGLMFCSLFLGLIDLCLFHLFTHALFKSLLFLCSGIMIYYMSDNQDIRFMGSFSYFMPLTVTCFNVSSFALMGMPFLSGFYSKDLIFELGLLFNLNFIFYLLFYLSIGLTSMYTFRLFFYSLCSNISFSSLIYMNEKFDFMTFSVLLLTFFSLTFGSVFIWVMNLDLNFVVFPIYVKIMPLILIFFGIWLGYELKMTKLNYVSWYFIMNGSMWFLMSYLYYLLNFYFKFSTILVYNLFWGEFYGGYGVSYFSIKFNNFIQYYFLSGWGLILSSMLLWLFMLI